MRKDQPAGSYLWKMCEYGMPSLSTSSGRPNGYLFIKVQKSAKSVRAADSSSVAWTIWLTAAAQ